MADEANQMEESGEFTMRASAERASPDLVSTGLPQTLPLEVEAPQGLEAKKMQFSPLSASGTAKDPPSSLDLILDVQLGATVELGHSRMSIREVLALGPGSLVELDKLAGEPADLLINGKPLARGEIVVIDEYFGIRITEIMTPAERIDSFR